MIPKVRPHKRIKPKTRPMNAAEKRHAARLRDMGCALTGYPPVMHHERWTRSGNIQRDHRYQVPLRDDLHKERHAIGHEKFRIKHGINLYQWARDAWAESERMAA